MKANEEFFKERIQKQLKTQTKDAEGQIKDKINADSKAINKNEATTGGEEDSKNSPKTKQASNKGIGRKNYGTMFYPSFIEKSNQDKLKITMLEFSSRFKGGKTGKDSKKDKTFIEKGGLAGVINRRYIKKTYKKQIDLFTFSFYLGGSPGGRGNLWRPGHFFSSNASADGQPESSNVLSINSHSVIPNPGC